MKDQAKTKGTLLTEVQKLQKEHNALKISYEKCNAEHKGVVEKLTISETNYRRLFETAKDGIILLDAKTGMITDVNPFLVELLGFTKEEFINKAIWEIGFFKDIAANQDKFLELQQKGYVRYDDLPLESIDGRKIRVEFVSNVYPVNHHRVIQCNIRNITERKKSEEFLRLSEEKYRTLFENVQDVFYKINLAGIIQDISPSIKHFSEFSRDEIIGTNVSSLYYNPNDRELLLDTIRKNGEVKDYEIQLKTKNGVKKFASLNARLIFDAIGKLHHIDGSLRDITERRQMENDLMESEKSYRVLFEGSTQGILAVDIETHRFLFSNPAICQLFGYTDAEFRQLSITDLPLKDSLDFVMSEFESQVRGENLISFALPFLRKDGTVFYAEIAGSSTIINGRKCIVGFFTDVTKRKELEEAMRKSESEFRLLAEAMPQIVWITDPKGLNTYFNNQWLKYTGQSLEESYGDGWNKPFHPDDQQRAWDAWQNATKNNATYSLECRLRRADGVYKWWLIRGSPVMDDHGTILKWFGTCTDIDMLKDSEEKLRESEQRLNDIIFSMADWVWEVDEHGVYTSSSKMGFDYFGSSREDVIGKTPFDFMPPFEAKRVAAIFSEIFKKRALIKDLENWNIRKNGDRICFLTNGVPIFDKEGNLKGYRGVDKDITEHMKLEESLRETNEYLENLINYANAPIIVWDSSFKITKFNHAFEELSRFTAAEVMGKNIDFLFLKEKAESYLSLINEPNKGERWESAEIEILTKNNEIRTVLWNSANIYDKEGKNIISTIAQGQDITVRKKAINDLFNINETLEARIVERTDQLNIVNRQLALHIKDIEQLTYIASHDLQEPLRTLTSFTQLIQEDYAGKLDEDGNKYIEFISNSAIRMRELIKHLLEYSLLGKESVLTIVDCNKLVGEVIDDMADSINKNNASITVQKLPIVNGYATELRQLFQNLIHNAIKFQRKDVCPKINISAKSHGKEWIFKIEDNGIGIQEKDKEKIFLIFKRLHNRDEYEGTGIGLAHCKKIVGMHGGTIWVESTPGSGSIFIFTIPKR